MGPEFYATLGVLVTFGIFLSHVVYRTGHVSARVEELERWRTNIRQDLHEISDQLEGVGKDIRHLTTIIEERTERRVAFREK